jgi:hypothetical protein
MMIADLISFLLGISDVVLILSEGFITRGNEVIDIYYEFIGFSSLGKNSFTLEAMEFIR